MYARAWLNPRGPTPRNPTRYVVMAIPRHTITRWSGTVADRSPCVGVPTFEIPCLRSGLHAGRSEGVALTRNRRTLSL